MHKDTSRGVASVATSEKKKFFEKGIESARWVIQRFASEEDKKKGVTYTKEQCRKLFGVNFQKSVINIDMVPGMGNMLVNTGINELWTLVAGTGGTKFDNTNAHIGVGDSDTAESASQTDLQASTNKSRKGMNSGYPTYGTSQKATWQSDFEGAEANYDWNEFGVFNASSSGVMLNRKVSDQGTKASGQVWTLSLEITLS